MEAALVGVATGAMKPLLSKLSMLLEEEYAKLKGVRRNTEYIKEEMATMSATLQMLADAEELDPQMKLWRDAVRELSYDMEDCVDDFRGRVHHESGRSTGLKTIYDWFKKLKTRHEIAGEIEELKKRAIEASERHRRYRIERPALDSSTGGIDPRLPALHEKIDKLVGIDGPKEHIIEWFNRRDSSMELQVVSIVGPGGLGKTTLANQVYLAIKDQIPCNAFVSVSRKPDIRKILRDIAREVGIKDNTSDYDVDQLIRSLIQHLQDKRYFIIIDDVWDTKAWDTIRLALQDNKHGSRIIATTRNASVASYSSSRGGYVYKIKPLTFDDSKKLFFERAFGKDLYYPHLEKVSDEILRKCDGLPLAIITLSSLLADQTAEDEWKKVIAAIGSALAKDPNAEKMAQILSFSYFDLPHHLRACLLYLSVFPEDSEINKQILINRWIAEGFVDEKDGCSTYEVGEGYFNDLVNRSLIQLVNMRYGRTTACRVHDIVLDFITCKATAENFVTSFDDVEQGKVPDHRVRRLCIMNYNNEMAAISARRNLSHIRSLTMFGDFMQNSLLDFPALRVLDLGECEELENHHLANIEKFVLLKYLRLGSSITELPRKIGELQYLETLDIRGTDIGELPCTITRLQRLARLYAHPNVIFPDGVIGQMQSLEALEGVGVFIDLGKYHQYLQEYGQLTKLRTLFVIIGWSMIAEGTEEDIQSYVGTLISSYNFHHLYISRYNLNRSYGPLSLESWHPASPGVLRKLYITGFYIDKVPNWMRLLVSLRELELSLYCLGPEGVEILGAIPALVFLKLETSYGSNGRICIHGGFRSLKYFNLEIKYCGTAVKFEAGSMPKLEHLELQFSPHTVECLNGAPSDLGIQHLSALTNVTTFIPVHSDIADEVARLIETAVGALPNRPTLSIIPWEHQPCQHFTKPSIACFSSGVLKREYEELYAPLTETIGSLQIEEEHGEQDGK